MKDESTFMCKAKEGDFRHPTMYSKFIALSIPMPFYAFLKNSLAVDFSVH